ncbi:hypothetical protein C8A00DRAFT_12032 [Chaetomidium leptoderma]|uniref:Aminoglycoside phosphotransferase domain-containing protein n=1 Tax=Chaetomidium leptoderma TaxID=669021 RepID=A0AAN6VSR9_9PEZI|nr:hypothetical protein C8A00DRAFT_12032 [Chaetomidium leptoderma]
MPATLEIGHRGPITYESALRKDADVISQAAESAATEELSRSLWDSRRTIEALVRHHRGLSDGDVCAVEPCDGWIRGGFNVCVPVQVRSGGARNAHKRLIFRCPMPHKLAEARYPGTVDEKLSCEVGTYAWMQDWCPDVRIPHLYGFGFSDHRHFTHEGRMPFYVRLWRAMRRRLRGLLGYPTLSRYAAHPASLHLPAAYVLLEYIGPDTGRMLSDTWVERRGDQARRRRLFRGMARVILSLARVPQPRIGSFQFGADGTVALTNRPLPCYVAILENDGAPRTIPKDETYTYTEPFVADLLALHDGSFLANRNAVYDAADGRGQMAARALLRTLSHRYVSRERRGGPFRLQLTDFHASNIFVDDDWNITCLIDLEWVCSLPAEMLAVPYWLTGRGIDQLVGDDLGEFDEVHQEFMDVLEKEEVTTTPGGQPALAPIMREGWESGTVWFWRCLTSVDAIFSLVEDHISPRYSPWSSKTEQAFSQYWCQGSADVVRRKVADHEKYVKELGCLFSKAVSVIGVPDSPKTN